MSISLDAAVQAQLDGGGFHILPLVKFEIPQNTVGYYVGPRPLVYNGFTYQPNRFMDAQELVETLDVDLGVLELTFSNVPAGDVVDSLESLEYSNAPVTLTRLVINPKLGVPDGIVGVAQTSFHQVLNIQYREGGFSSDGLASNTFTVRLGTPGKVARTKTHAVRSHTDQQFDNLATDTFLERVATVSTISREWGQRSG